MPESDFVERSTMALLQKLLSDRNEVMVLHRDAVFCSCGSKFHELDEAENHLVQHPRVEVQNNEMSKILSRLLSELSRAMKRLYEDEGLTSADPEPDLSVLKEVEMPEKVCCVTLEEDDLKAGEVFFAYSCSSSVEGGLSTLVNEL